MAAPFVSSLFVAVEPRQVEIPARVRLVLILPKCAYVAKGVNRGVAEYENNKYSILAKILL